MSLFDRILLAGYTLIITTLLVLISIVFIGIFWGFIYSDQIIQYFQMITGFFYYPETSVLSWLGVILLVLIGFRLFYISLFRSNKQQALVHDYALGQVHITLQTVEGLVKKAAYKVDGVREVRPRIITTSEGINIAMTITILPDISIPEVSEKIQSQVKAYILQVTGMPVNNVKVVVENIHAHTARVE
ncbi:alkaline shock response membrane anchor protein AmaP [Peptococcaceae bacterium]|nr:alkaline shock response membrane anchor protein AmaP [Peptococcaceae bacterium]